MTVFFRGMSVDERVALTLGLTDGSATEVREGDLKEGQEVVVGIAGSGGKKKGDRTPRLGR